MMLSIIVPVYNEEKTIKKVLKTILKTNLGIKKQIVVVNDGSSDKTGVVIDLLSQKYNEVRALHNRKNKGLALAWRTGVDAAKKEIILYIEGDGQKPFDDQLDLLKMIDPINQLCAFLIR